MKKLLLLSVLGLFISCANQNQECETPYQMDLHQQEGRTSYNGKPRNCGYLSSN